MSVDATVLSIIAYPYVSKHTRILPERDFIFSLSFDGRICPPSVAKNIVLYAIEQGYLTKVNDELLKMDFKMDNVKVAWVFQSRELKIFDRQNFIINSNMSVSQIIMQLGDKDTHKPLPKNDNTIPAKKENQRKRRNSRSSDTLINYLG